MRLGVAGAGTMGAGIAEAARAAGLDVRVHDPHVPGTVALEELAGCDVVIEAAPEDLELKRGLFRALAGVVGDDAVLATNTSSLTVGAIAAAVPRPERVVGLHFFNPVPRMRLVELVAGAASSPEALARARAVAEAMGKQVVLAQDGPGFLVNRCNRPFGLEAMRIVQERLATPEQVDRVCRLALGFRMGPFELMDLVGIDVGVAIAASFHAQTLEPRWRPSPLAARLAESGRLGRKTGPGLVRLSARPAGGPAGARAGRRRRPARRRVGRDGGRRLAARRRGGRGVGRADAVGGRGRGAVPDPRLRARRGGPAAAGRAAGAAVRRGAALGAGPGRERRRLRAAAAGRRRRPGRAHPHGDDRARRRPRRWRRSSPRSAAARSGSATARASSGAASSPSSSTRRASRSARASRTRADIDLGMELGLNHPRGPLAWGDRIGPGAVLDTLLALWEEYREERYRPAPALVRAVRAESELAAGASIRARPSLDVPCGIGARRRILEMDRCRSAALR